MPISKPILSFLALEYNSWPTAQSIGLNESELRALFSALTTRVSLIQGAPNKAKTPWMLKTVAALLNNKDLWQDKMEIDDLLEQLVFEKSRSWLEKNVEFWKNEGSQWTDHRLPILVIFHSVKQVRFKSFIS